MEISHYYNEGAPLGKTFNLKLVSADDIHIIYSILIMVTQVDKINLITLKEFQLLVISS